MRNIHLRYVDETYDENGLLKTFRTHYPDNFNWGYDIVDDIAINDPKRRALVWCDERGYEKILTFADIKRLSDKTANYLTSKGIRKGDMVLVVLKHNYQFWYVSVALHKMGAVLIPATYMLKKADIEYRINAASVRGVICTSDAPVWQEFDAAENIPTLKFKAMTNMSYNGIHEGWDDFDKEVEAASDQWTRVKTNVKDMMLIYFTSGTSGNPKMATHDFSYPIGHILGAKHWHCVEPDGIHFTVAETGWAKCAWGKLYGAWEMEACLFAYEYEKFDPKKILDLIEKYRITTFCCPPTMFRMYVNAGLEGHDLSSLHNCCIAGEALNSDTFDKWYQATGLKLMEAFGQTETAALVANLKGMTPKPGSMGKPSPQYRVDIVDPDGRSCPPGINGEIVVSIEPRVPGIFVGYYRDRLKTRETLFNGFHHTGDIAWKDEDGYYWYVGRNDDIIKSSGYRISPFEIESVLLKHPAVLECAVTGVPDPVRGQIVKATVVLRSSYAPSDELKKELQIYVKESTAPYKYPRAIEFVEELPKSVSGKVKRVAIRNEDIRKSKEKEHGDDL
jgi:acetyl-CoA synthetase